MIEIGKTIVARDVLEKKFACKLQACKGICCVEGDSGAPLEEEELTIMDDIFEDVKPFMRAEGIAEVMKQGKYMIDSDGDYVTPLINEKECAYTVFDENGIAGCAIENAHNAGHIDFQKPLSCHLYPIKITKYKKFDAVNYHTWDVCKQACNFGVKQNIAVFEFAKTALIRKFGQQWYNELVKVQKALNG